MLDNVTTLYNIMWLHWTGFWRVTVWRVIRIRMVWGYIFLLLNCIFLRINVLTNNKHLALCSYCSDFNGKTPNCIYKCNYFLQLVSLTRIIEATLAWFCSTLEQKNSKVVRRDVSVPTVDSNPGKVPSLLQTKQWWHIHLHTWSTYSHFCDVSSTSKVQMC